MKTSKYVESYWIQEYECGIFLLIFNTTERWINYHQYSDTQYIFGNEVDESESQEDWESRIQDVEEFLPKEKSFLPTVIQNKNQISFYFIPYNLISHKK